MPTVWLIEDNIAFREATEFALQHHHQSYQWCSFERCEDALVEMKKGKFADVILLDVELPGMNGIDGISKFRSIQPDACVLILTVFEHDDKIFRAICAGASGYLLKTETLPKILEAVDQVIAGGSPINPRIAKKVLGMFTQMAPVKEDYGLTPREKTALELMVEGLAKKQIAERMEVSVHTVSHFIRAVYRKLHVNCQSAAVSLAVRKRII